MDLSHTIIFLASNLGGGEITELMTGGMGFVLRRDKRQDRLDKVVVFHPRRQEQRASHRSFEREAEAPAVPAIAKSVRRAGAEVRAASGGNAVEVFAGAKARSVDGSQVLLNDDK